MPEGIAVTETSCKTALNKTGIPGYQYCLNPYVGCAHACVYCYASFMCRFRGRREPWGTFVECKINFPAVLERQLKRLGPKGGSILTGTVTDPYQQAEASYCLTRSCLEALAPYPSLELGILTKSALVLRDLSLLQKLKCCTVGFSITTMSNEAARVLEPGASPPGLRLAAARQLSEAGVPVWVFIAPLLPGVGDSGEALSALFGALKKAGVREVMADTLTAYPLAVGRLRQVYRRYFPASLKVLEWYLKDSPDYRMIIDDRMNKLARDNGINFSSV
ncbi:radical SAM protein [Pelotomaculum terephthalicicum JT]|uniref:SPL family radical SAM protein n=1 Tax=Pelotomaculum terephthalicicum TaxID=206393 RepID=UPI001F03EEDA|nr:radical SAM protein [Pelotomaculum terephthalicicum]MCG9969401.1 radical SAM protein [Pelotomaculum terephthalicicum JT]